MTPELSVRRNFSWTIVGNIIYAASQWGTLVCIARLGSQEMVGQFSLALAIAGPIFLFTNLQLRVVQATDTTGHHNFYQYLSVRLMSSLVGVSLVVSVAILFDYNGLVFGVIAVVAASRVVESISDILYGLFQLSGRMDYIAKSMIIKGLASLITVYIGLMTTHDIIGAVVFMFLSWLGVLVAYDLPIALRQVLVPEGRPIISFSAVIEIVSATLPLGLVALVLSLNTYIPRYLIESHLGMAELGVFSALSYLLLIGATVNGALGQASVTKLARYYAEGQLDAFRDLLMRLCYLGLGTGLVGWGVVYVLGGPILTLVYGSQYGQYSPVLSIIFVSGIFAYLASILGVGMTAVKYYRTQVVVFMLVAVVALAANLGLIAQFGLIGAAWASVVTAVVQCGAAGLAITHALVRRPSS